MIRRPPRSTLFPTRRSSDLSARGRGPRAQRAADADPRGELRRVAAAGIQLRPDGPTRAREVRSEEHTSELQSQSNLVCRLLLEKKKNTHHPRHYPTRALTFL